MFIIEKCLYVEGAGVTEGGGAEKGSQPESCHGMLATELK